MPPLAALVATTPTATMTTSPDRDAIAAAIKGRKRFVISSHARPDGDSIGSSMAMAYALRALGKHVDVVMSDAAPPPLMQFPGVPDIRIAPQVDGQYDAAIIMECGDLARTGVAGFEQYFVVNIDHHPGNTGYGDLRWFDSSAAALGEMIFDLVGAIGTSMSREVA